MTKKQEPQMMICPKARECRSDFKGKLRCCITPHKRNSACDLVCESQLVECCIPYEPATCPDWHDECICGHLRLHHIKWTGKCHCCDESEIPCKCTSFTPVDLQPEKHCTAFEELLQKYKDGSMSASDVVKQFVPEQPTPTMPLREQEQLYGWDLDKRLDDFKTIAERLEDENYHSRAKAVLYLIERCKRAEAHDAEVASKAVKEFAEKVIATMTINNQVKKQRVLMIAHIRALAEGKE